MAAILESLPAVPIEEVLVTTEAPPQDSGKAQARIRRTAEDARRRIRLEYGMGRLEYLNRWRSGWRVELSHDQSLIWIEGPGIEVSRGVVRKDIAKATFAPGEVIIEGTNINRPEAFETNSSEAILHFKRIINLLFPHRLRRRETSIDNSTNGSSEVTTLLYAVNEIGKR